MPSSYGSQERNLIVSRVFITGSSDGLGLAAVTLLIGAGHEVVGHARNAGRAAALRQEAPGVAAVVVGDLSSAAETRAVADQVNALGRCDAVIHNAGVGYREQHRITTADGHEHVLAINVLAPYLLTALIERPARLVYLSSGMHRGGVPSVDDLDWERRRWNASQAYSDSKLFDTVLAFAIARRWPDVLSNAVEPGWVPTKMGGPGAPDDLALGHTTQAWLAVSDDPAATVSGAYFYHQRPREVHPAARSHQFQDELTGALDGLTGVKLPA
jgi:NAD(P)-dependent dehydrogenase (short-subunit alcohol dehydrogenase family)